MFSKLTSDLTIGALAMDRPGGSVLLLTAGSTRAAARAIRAAVSATDTGPVTPCRRPAPCVWGGIIR